MLRPQRAPLGCDAELELEVGEGLPRPRGRRLLPETEATCLGDRAPGPEVPTEGPDGKGEPTEPSSARARGSCSATPALPSGLGLIFKKVYDQEILP